MLRPYRPILVDRATPVYHAPSGGFWRLAQQ